MLNSHPGKIKLKVIQNRLTQMSEKLLAEEQASFRVGISTVAQLFKSNIKKTSTALQGSLP